MAIAVLVIGVIVFGIGVAGQFGIGRKHGGGAGGEGDRHTARLVLTLAAIVVGAWLTIMSIVNLMHSHHYNFLGR